MRSADSEIDRHTELEVHVHIPKDCCSSNPNFRPRIPRITGQPRGLAGSEISLVVSLYLTEFTSLVKDVPDAWSGPNWNPKIRSPPFDSD